MTNALIWMISLVLLAVGGFVLLLGARQYAVDRVLMERFHHHVAQPLNGASLSDRGLSLLEWLGRRIVNAQSLKDLQSLLIQAGLPGSATPFIFATLRLTATVAVFAAMLLPRYLHQGVRLRDAGLAFFAGFIAYRAFTIFLKSRMESRQREIRRELPYVLDLVLMVLDSGVSIDQALRHVGEHIGKVASICGVMLRRYNAETEEGVPYDLALDRLAQRLLISEGRDFASLLKQNLYQGGELSPPLRRLAADIGDVRLAMAREQAGRKSVLLTLVMLAFFMPVLMIALAGPAVSDITSTLSSVAHKSPIPGIGK